MAGMEGPGKRARGNSFPPPARLRKHADYQRVYRTGKKQSLPLLTYFYAPRASEPATGSPPASGPRVGLTAGRVLGNAVVRNRIKRRMRAAIRGNSDALTAAADVILHPRRSVLDADFALIERDVQRALRAVQTAMQDARPLPDGSPQASARSPQPARTAAASAPGPNRIHALKPGANRTRYAD